MRPTPIACAALLFTGITLAAQDMDTPPSPPAPPAPPSARLAPPPPPPRGSLGSLGGLDMALGPGGRALHALDLTAEQRRQIRDLVRTARDQGMGDAFQALHGARQELERALWDPSSDEARLGALRQAAIDAEDRLLSARRPLAHAVLQVLSEDQRAAFLQLLDETPTWGPPRP
jgi:Spy/CpxP family protein refolding chaperone